jgi:hypothetical protein
VPGTLSADDFKEMVDSILNGNYAWLDRRQMRKLKDAIGAGTVQDRNVEQIRTFVTGSPPKKAEVLELIRGELAGLQELRPFEDDVDRLFVRLDSNPSLSDLLK